MERPEPAPERTAAPREAPPVALRELLRRGLARRCPACGRAPLFEGWIRLRARCPDCGVRPLRSQGDHWAFLLVLDRLPLFAILAILYFQLYARSGLLTVAVFAAVVVAYVVTVPHRYGLAVALDYWTRVRWPAG